jgi:hypothetical protein
MPPTTDTELKELRDLVIGLREEMRVGFANVDTKIERISSKIDVKSIELTSKIEQLEAKTDTEFAELTGKIDVIDERTKLGFWGFVARAVIISTVGIAVSLAVKYFFFGITKP